MKTAAFVAFPFALVGAFALGAYTLRPRVQAPEPVATQPQAVHVRPAVEIISIRCEDRAGRVRAEVVVKNIAYPVSFLRGFVNVGGTVHAGYFTPENLPNNSLATLTLYGNKGDAAEPCTLDAIQNGGGERGNIQ